MISFDVAQIYPKFILNDRNGYAMAKAIEKALTYFLTKCQDGLDALQDVEKMPEWRLDEVAWETNCLYDYNADVDIKREWIRNEYDYFKRHGTPEGIRQYLAAYFGESSILEWFDNDLSAGYFDVMVTGTRTDENEAWIRASVEKAKNVRSILRYIIFNGGTTENVLKFVTAIAGVEAMDKVNMAKEKQLYVRDLQQMDVGYLQKKTIRKIT